MYVIVTPSCVEAALPIPTYDRLMLPVLQHAAQKTWDMRDLIARLADDLDLTTAEREQKIPSGGTRLLANRVHWAKTYLKQAGLVEQPARGKVQITEAGRALLQSNPEAIDVHRLQQSPAFMEFLSRTRSNGQPMPGAVATGQADSLPAPAAERTPEEQIEAASTALNASLRDTLLARVLEASPESFEKLIIDVLLAMGYGGSRSDAGEQLGRSGDGGVDGVIREDRLGLDRIYLQAKRYRPGNAVGSELDYFEDIETE